jgi:phosphatidylserine/phosphatidylglycerophosphate/cardiolipin synthase-like enzyme
MAAPTPKVIDQTIRKNLAKLTKPGVLTVRPGYEIANHQLTGKSAIVATVHTKKTGLAKSELLPERIAGIPVDVREATAYQRLRVHDPAAAAVTKEYGRPELREPTWPFEREIPSGRLLDDPKSSAQRALARSATQQPATQRALQAHSRKPRIDYVPAPDTPLDTVTTTTTVTAHVSPDAGLATLEAFLDDTQQSLVVGMYDFTSGRILETFIKDLGPDKTLQMVLDNPAPNPTRDQTDTQTVDELNQSLADRAKIARALDRADMFASAWIFPYAYHIKVIVRDGTAFWLSSGNLNNSNQPDLTAPPHTEDRDWHVIIEDAGLARTFAAYLNQDFLSAGQHQADSASDIAVAVTDAHAKLAAEANPPPAQPLTAAKAKPVPAKVFKNIDVKITPLLTPDKLPDDATKGQYLTNILQLISSAQEKLYIQLQYIEASSGSGDYDTLLSAIAERVQAGVDVRLIESLQYGEKWAEKMKSTGVDLSANIRLQPDVHNKGFVVDSRTVVVSSQNFSPAGIEENRDAGVIIESAEIATYFEPIFLSDWNNKAKPFAPKTEALQRQQTRSAGLKKKHDRKPVATAAKRSNQRIKRMDRAFR